MSAETLVHWPSNIPQLKRLDELLRCGICYEFMSTSMVTVCSHNYCSLCIRQYLSYKTQCPACFRETTSQQLRNNRLIDEIILLFPQLRDKVVRQCQVTRGSGILGYLVTDNDKKDEVDKQVPESNKLAAKNHLLSPNRRRTLDEDDLVRSPASSPVVKDFFSPRTSRESVETPKRNLGKLLSSSSFGTPIRGSQPTCSSSSTSGNNNSNRPSNKNKSQSKAGYTALFGSQASSRSPHSSQQNDQPMVSSGYFSSQFGRSDISGVSSVSPDVRVPCPVCNVSVPDRNINQHLDDCLKRMNKGNEEEIDLEKVSRKPLPKLVYSLLSEKQVRQKLKETGLSTLGDKPVLVNRHRRYVTLYNAECDVANPRPIPELIRQLELEEREETRGTSSRSIFTYDRKTAPEIIEKEQKDYIKKNNDHFAKLIADVKRRQAESKRKKLKEDAEEARPSSSGLDVHPTSTVAEKDLAKECVSDKVSGVSKHSVSTCIDTVRLECNSKEEHIISALDKSQEINIEKRAQKEEEDEEESNNNVKLFKQPVTDVETCDSGSSQACRGSPQSQSQKASEVDIADGEVVDPSPDLFIGSPGSSLVSSTTSVSLLEDCESISLQLSVGTGLSDEEVDEYMIPAHQPESFQEEINEVAKSPSPQIGRKSTRSSKSTTPKHLLEPFMESQCLTDKTPEDPDYFPSQELESMESEDFDLGLMQEKPRRSSRKRKEKEGSIPQKVTRKKRR